MSFKESITGIVIIAGIVAGLGYLGHCATKLRGWNDLEPGCERVTVDEMSGTFCASEEKHSGLRSKSTIWNVQNCELLLENNGVSIKIEGDCYEPANSVTFCSRSDEEKRKCEYLLREREGNDYGDTPTFNTADDYFREGHEAYEDKAEERNEVIDDCEELKQEIGDLLGTLSNRINREGNYYYEGDKKVKKNKSDMIDDYRSEINNCESLLYSVPGTDSEQQKARYDCLKELRERIVEEQKL